MAWGRQIYTSVEQIKGTNNTMADAASKANQLLGQMFLRHFKLTFLQKKRWWLIPFLYKCRQRLTSMLHRK